MGVAPFSVTQERKEVVQFTEIYYEEPNALLIPLPMEESKLMAFTKPFHSLVWLFGDVHGKDKNVCTKTESIRIIEEKTGRDVSYVTYKDERCHVKFVDSTR